MSSININNKRFTSINNSGNGEVSSDTQFHYHQDNNVIWADYDGGSIVKGHLIGTIDSQGNLDFRYHHINVDGDIMLGTCKSTYSVNDAGKIEYYEKWQWLCGDHSHGESTIVEM